MTAPFSSSKTDLFNKAPTRRTILTRLAGASLLGFKTAKAANPSGSITPSSVVSQPARAWGAQAGPSFLPDPDVLFLDPSFKDLTYFAAPIRRVWDQGGWLEGPAWSTEGRFLVLSDVIRSRALRYTWETGEISDFRPDSYAANGNCFDFTGRLIVCEDFFRRVVRWEHDGSVKVLADRYNGQGLNSPNDVVPHPDGSVWFTDPGYGTNLAEGHPDAPGGPTNPDGKIRWNIGRELIGEIGGTKRQSDHVFRIAPDGTLTAVLQEKDIRDPNGLCFSPDYKKLYIVSTLKGPGQSVGGDQAIHVYDVKDGTLSNGRIFSTMQLNGVQMNPDGIRVDVFGNLWCGASGPLGLCGVMVFNPAGKLIGRIRLPQGCSNLTFGGPKRDHLFMCAANSLFALQVGVQGFAPS